MKFTSESDFNSEKETEEKIGPSLLDGFSVELQQGDTHTSVSTLILSAQTAYRTCIEGNAVKTKKKTSLKQLHHPLTWLLPLASAGLS